MLPATEDEATSSTTIANLNESTIDNVAIAISATISEAVSTTTITTVTSATSTSWTDSQKSTKAQTTETNSFLSDSFNQSNVASSSVCAMKILPQQGQDQSTSIENTSSLIVGTLNQVSASSTISPPPLTEHNVIKTAVLQTAMPFGAQNRSQQRQKIKSYHDAKHTAWRTAISASNLRQSFMDDSANANTQPSEQMYTAILKSTGSQSSEGAMSMPRRVSFPEGDKELVTGYLEPANPWEQANLVKSISEITNLYMLSCKKHNTKPLETVLDHLKVVDLNSYSRQPRLSLKYLKLAPNDCEPLEEVFKRIQYKLIELSGCSLDESAVSALCQMIEYYEAANELDISYNKEGMTHRGWHSCSYMVGKSQELHVLNAEGNVISKLSAENLGNALNTSNLHTLKLEHCGLKGAPLTSFCCKLYKNKLLKELWLAYNDLDCTDAAHIADLLRYNHYIELVDISNNNIRDEGMMYLVQALLMQSSELERRSNMHRAAAIEDESLFSMDESIPIESDYININDITADSGTVHLENSPKSVQENFHIDDDDRQNQILQINVSEAADSREKNLSFEFDDIKSTSSPVDDDDTEETIKTMRNGNKTTANQSQAGQSMLDKLLSMNSDSSSSEDGPSIISPDSLSGWCSKEDGVISNDIDTMEPAIKKVEATQVIIPTTSTFSSSILDTSIQTDGTLVLESSKENMPSLKASSGKDINSLADVSNILYNEQNVNIGDVNNDTTSTTASSPTSSSHKSNGSRNSKISIFDLTAEENDGGLSRQLDVNKMTKNAIEDYEDTHSTDSAFESASEGDISRHLPDEFSRFTGSLESTRLDDIAKEIAIETATIATESTECLAMAEEATTPILTPTSVAAFKKPSEASEIHTDERSEIKLSSPPKVIIAADPLLTEKEKNITPSTVPSSLPTLPPPSTSPGSLGSVMRRSESTTQYLNQSVRVHSQSSDSLCSDTSLDGSSSLTDHNLAEKLTKNDTLSRRNLVNFSIDANNKSQSGLKALTVWNNNLTKDSGKCIAELLSKSFSLELLNIGKNCLSNDFVATIKDSLIKNTTLTTLGLQSAHLSAKGVETLASILTFGGNNNLQRIDIRDNKLDVESLNIIADVLKSNKTISQIDINDEPKRLTIGSDAHLSYARVLENVRSMCSRNEKIQTKLQAEKTINITGSGSDGGGNRCRGGYYLGSRKISLTCHSRPLVDAATGTVTSSGAVSTTSTVTPTPAAKLVVKRKSGVRLRSPGPSPPTISPSSSPNRSRFQVSRVHEVSPLKSPLAQIPPPHLPTSKSAAVTSASSSCAPFAMAASCLPTSCSLPTMVSVASSTQTVGRHSVSPCSRFHVSRIFEDPKVPLSSHLTSQLTPPLNPPPTPMLKSARNATQLPSATDATQTTSTVVIKEPAATDKKNHLDSSGIDFKPSTNERNLSTHSSTNLLAQQPISSNLSSTSTSPISLNSSSSSSLLSSSPSSSTKGVTTTATTTTPASTDSCSPSSSLLAIQLAEPAAKICPIVVFGDNDITLTKESAANFGLSAACVQNQNATNEVIERLPVVQQQPEQQPKQQQQQQQQKACKISWIANPTAVDKLLTLFNSSTIFQRSSSQEPKTKSPSSNASSTTNSESSVHQQPEQQSTVAGASTIPLTAKSNPGTDTPDASTSSSSADISSNGTCAINVSSTNSSSMSNAAAATIEQSLYFLDSASRQFRDFSKTVFRQNLSIGNDSSVATSYEPGTSTSTSASASAASTTSSTASPECCDIAHIPINIKKELKENISPKHTVNEDTLHSLQKLAKAEESQTAGVVESVVCNQQVVAHDKLIDCLDDVGDNVQEQSETYSAVAARIATQNT